MHARHATAADAAAVVAIYNAGIAERTATFETRPRTAADLAGWWEGRYPVIVVEAADGSVIAFASTSSYRPRECYATIAEFSVYVAPEARGQGAGRLALDTLCQEAQVAGFTKLVSRVFVENVASRALMRRAGFREVGIYESHGQLDGRWRDVVIVERVLLPLPIPEQEFV